MKLINLRLFFLNVKDIGILYLIFALIVGILPKLNHLFNDAPIPYQITFQDPASYGFTGIIDLHNSIFFFLAVIALSVFWMLKSIILVFNSKKGVMVHKYWTHGTFIELVWTIGPAILLLFIANPSFNLLYILDEVISPAITIKTIGIFKNGLKSHIFNKIKDIFIIKKNLLFNKFFHTNIRAKNRIGPHNNDVISVIIGLLLGDGYAENRTGEGVRIKIRQSIIHKEYLFFLYDFLFEKGYCSINKPKLYTRKIKNINKLYYGYEFNTFTFRSFVWIYKLFYKKGKKYINKNIVNYITPLTLAIWIMDDGCWTGYGVRIATNAFTLAEVKLLSNILIHKFNLDCTIQTLSEDIKSPVNKNEIKNKKYSIYIKKNSVDKLTSLILKYMHPSMYYKLNI